MGEVEGMTSILVAGQTSSLLTGRASQRKGGKITPSVLTCTLLWFSLHFRAKADSYLWNRGQ